MGMNSNLKVRTKTETKKQTKNNFMISKIARDLEEKPLIIELKRLLGNGK